MSVIDFFFPSSTLANAIFLYVSDQKEIYQASYKQEGMEAG